MRKIVIVLLVLLGITGISQAQDSEATPQEIAEERIAEAARTGATELSLSYFGLTELPPEIGNLTNLIELNLHDNELTSLPPEIGNLTNLIELNLHDNELTSLPPEIGNLTNLLDLNLQNNELTTLPPEIGNLTALQLLNLSENAIRVLPPQIGLLANLCRLDLSDNELTALPAELRNIEGISPNGSCAINYSLPLRISGNPLTDLPPHIRNQDVDTILKYVSSPFLWYLQWVVAAAIACVIFWMFNRPVSDATAIKTTQFFAGLWCVVLILAGIATFVVGIVFCFASCSQMLLYSQAVVIGIILPLVGYPIAMATMRYVRYTMQVTRIMNGLLIASIATLTVQFLIMATMMTVWTSMGFW